MHEEKQTGDEWFDTDYRYEWWETYRTLRCAGCDAISLQIDSGNSEAFDDHGQPDVKTRHYPPRIFRAKPRWCSELAFIFNCPDEIQDLLKEVYICLQNDCVRAAAMAARALLEHVFVSTCGDQGSFTRNVDAFQKAGHLSQSQRELLDTVLDAGHATMHRSFKPSKHDLSTVMDVVEIIIQLQYVHNQTVQELKKRIPQRANRPKGQS
ncbi:MAG TPA: DUF4145 domain-containing protein [Candidatus Binatia bacterium]|nr:DUF4145 domain-containing protein [Candidatus Binatia bacterium]